MSAAVLCSACQMGDHEHHDGSHHGQPGVIGGHQCWCIGGCQPLPNPLIEAARPVSAVHPLVGAIDRGLVKIGVVNERFTWSIRDAILAEIEAEWGPLTVEGTGSVCDSGCQPEWHRDDCAIYLPAQTRLVSDWRAEQ